MLLIDQMISDHEGDEQSVNMKESMLNNNLDNIKPSNSLNIKKLDNNVVMTPDKII